MAMIYLVTLVILLLSLLCSLIRCGLGPTWFDRILAVNTFTTKSILVIAVYFFATGHPEYIDIALLYTLLSYVGTLAFANYFNQNSKRNGLKNPGSTTPDSINEGTQ
jgi:multicomponent Na+:H+ antiporter subunit F